MQSDGNSFCGDVVLDSFNVELSEEDSILDENMKSKLVTLLQKLWILRVIDEYAYLNKYSA